MRDTFAISGRNPRDYTVEVVNAAGERVLELPFSGVFDHEVAQRPFLAS